MVGSIIGNYKIISKLGEGGMGVVYKALDLKLERLVALKILSSQTAQSPQFIERFKREARNQAKLTHPNIIPVYGFLDEHGYLGIAMEFVDGETLEQIIDRKGRLDQVEALTYLKQMLSGIGYAHKMGFIHRDIKPSNVLIDKFGNAKIMDFGISKSVHEKGITKTGTKIGTLLYMSPEQINADDPTIQSDIYSLGITLYEMLSGVTPFEYQTEFEIMNGHLKQKPPRITAEVQGLHPEIDKLIMKALEKDPMQRYSTCDEFAQLVDYLINAVKFPQTRKTKEESPFEQEKKQLRKKKISVYIVLTIVFAALVGFSYVFYGALASFWPQLKKGTLGQRQATGDTTFSYKASINYFGADKWIPLETGFTGAITSVAFSDYNTGLASGDTGTVLKTVNAGDTWVTLKIDTKATLNDVVYIEGTGFLIVGQQGEIYSSQDTGTTWKKMESFTDATLMDAEVLSNGKVVVVGNQGTILLSRNRGYTWERVNSPTGELLFSVYFLDTNFGFACGRNGVILKSEDGGASWKQLPSFTTNYIRRVVFTEKNNGFAAGGGGIIFHTEDGGNTWEEVFNDGRSGIISFLFKDKEEGFAVTSRGDLLVTGDGGFNWSIGSSGRGVAPNSLYRSPDGRVFMAGSPGSILKYKN